MELTWQEILFAVVFWFVVVPAFGIAKRLWIAKRHRLSGVDGDNSLSFIGKSKSRPEHGRLFDFGGRITIHQTRWASPGGSPEQLLGPWTCLPFRFGTDTPILFSTLPQNILFPAHTTPRP